MDSLSGFLLPILLDLEIFSMYRFWIMSPSTTFSYLFSVYKLCHRSSIMNVLNKTIAQTPLTELMAIDFVVDELELYLDTHSDYIEACEMYQT